LFLAAVMEGCWQRGLGWNIHILWQGKQEQCKSYFPGGIDWLKLGWAGRHKHLVTTSFYHNSKWVHFIRGTIEYN
jgi:hypothetical protein